MACAKGPDFVNGMALARWQDGITDRRVAALARHGMALALARHGMALALAQYGMALARWQDEITDRRAAALARHGMALANHSMAGRRMAHTRMALARHGTGPAWHGTGPAWHGPLARRDRTNGHGSA